MHIMKGGASDYGAVKKEALREDGYHSKVGTVNEWFTPTNYCLTDNFAPTDIDAFIKDLGVKRKIRADAVRFVSVIIDYPKDETRDTREFFFEAKRAIQEFYKIKESAVLYAEVHLDEANPHMHFAFVPIVEKNKKYKDGHEETQIKLSAKEVVTKESLQNLHPYIQDHMREHGFLGTMFYDDDVKRDKDFMEHKLKMMDVELDEKTESVQKAENELESLRGEVDVLKEQKKTLESELEGLRETYERIEGETIALVQQQTEIKGTELQMIRDFLKIPQIAEVWKAFSNSVKNKLSASKALADRANAERANRRGMSMNEWVGAISKDKESRATSGLFGERQNKSHKKPDREGR